MRKRALFPPLAGALAVSISIFTYPSSRAQEPVSFVKDIQPIFEQSCWSCHSQTLQLSRLDLSSRDSALRGGEHGPALVPGRADDSRLYRLIAGLEKPGMPLDGVPLTKQQIAAVKTWIDQGAHWDAAPVAASAPASSVNAGTALEHSPLPPGARDYWAFQLPVQAPVPTAAAHLTNPIDRFLENTRAAKGLKAAPRADRLTLLRRASLDLIGLPPTPDQTKAFLADTAPGSWARLIETLLASPHYGERWARHWLDAARYADTSGYEEDNDRPNIWRYRDYVIRSLNSDKPYNVFLTEQVAGDELDHKTTDSYIATAFLRLGPRVGVREGDNPQYRFDYLDDMIATIGKGTLGLTLQCARCHNHKFDPILQRDYYALQASLFGYVETSYPLAPQEQVDAHDRKVEEINAKQAPLRAEVRKIEAPYRERLRAEAIRRDFPPNVQLAVARPEAERTEGEKLLADQVLESAVINVKVDEAMTPEDLARRKALDARINTLDEEWPRPLPAADIVTDGDYRFSPDRPTEGTVAAANLAALRAQLKGSYLHTGPGRYAVPPSYFLIRGDINAKGGRTQPGFVTVATYGNPATEIPRPDGRTSGRRLALARWLTSRENPLAARVMVKQQPISCHDLHATMLHLLGIDHTRLTYRFNGRNMRLTDVYGDLIPQIVG